MKKGLLGVAVGLAAAAGSAWAVRRLLGSNDAMAGTYGETGTVEGIGESGSVEAPRREGLDPTLLEILACPEDKEPVIYQKEGDAERLTCTKCGKRYPVRDGIPVMLIDEATPGPVPTPEEIAAARALAPQGKPAIVGAAAPEPPAAQPAGEGGEAGTAGSS